jgi:hypothetical protein
VADPLIPDMDAWPERWVRNYEERAVSEADYDIEADDLIGEEDLLYSLEEDPDRFEDDLSEWETNQVYLDMAMEREEDYDL